MKHIVVEAHKTKYPDPIRFKQEEWLTVGKKDGEYEGWIWVTTEDGKQGWAPIQYLQIEEKNRAVARRDYTAAELDTCVGEELVLHYELNDWGWVENRHGATGWIPMKTISEM